MIKRTLWLLALAMLLPLPVARAQDASYPLPAPLYILTSEQRVLRIDPVTGEQRVISPEGQPVSDFAIAPDGQWYAYRSPANGAVVVSELVGSSGYVLEFDVDVPASGPARTIGWAPDASALAYIIPEGVRIAALGADEFGAPVSNTVQGPWVEFYWETPESLVARDASGSATRISGRPAAWTVAAAPAWDASAQMAVPARLTPEGVMLADNTLVPRTAGALAFEWGPAPLPAVEGLALPRDLYYVAPSASGVEQVWRLPASGESAAPVTSAADSVLGYDVAPGGIAYVAAGQLWAAASDGTNPRALAMVELEFQRGGVDWSPDAARLAYHDARGVWTVPVDGSEPPHLLVENARPVEGTAPSEVRVHLDPRWSPDGSRLLVTIGLYEGAQLGIVDVSSGEVTALQGAGVAEAIWTPDGQVLAWSQYGMYGVAGLYVLDPQAPSGQPIHLVDEGTPVVNAAHGTDGRWYALIAATPGMGPQWVRAWVAESLGSDFAPLYEGAPGGFAQESEIAPPDPSGDLPAMAAGFETVTYDMTAHGPLVVLDLHSGAAVRVQGAEQARELRWGP